ncbi:MAG: DUF1573 domain-containing protein [Flavobacteriaceae bacterium]|nr:DUF1573 domain-containing protein [Flavobacteriaceae bacterium]
MRTLLTFIIVVFMSASSFGQDGADFTFKAETINYGKIALKSNGVRVFEFTNTGNAPLIITKIISSCGCTVPKKPEEPIMPGEKGKIEVKYDTSRVGGFSKAITIYSNAKSGRKVLKIKGYEQKVLAPEKKKSLLSDS